MKLGTSHRIIWDYEVLESFDFLKSIGYEALELWVEYPRLALDLVTDETIRKIRNKIKESNLTVTIHAPIRDINISSLNYGSRNEAVRQIKQAIDFAESVGVNIVVMHPGKNSSKKDPVELTMELFYESMSKIVKYAEEKEIYLALEHMERRNGEYILEAEEILEVISMFNSKYLKITFDIAHCNTVTKDIVKFYKKIREHVIHIHVSDNNGYGSKTHMKIGDGSINFEEIFNELKNDGYSNSIIIEGYYPEKTKEVAIQNYIELKNLI